MSTVRLLAIDPGSHCGYSIMDVAQPVSKYLKTDRKLAGIWDLQQKRFEGAGMRFMRLQKFLQDVNPDFVVYEQVNFPHKSTCAAALYWGCVSTITTFCEANGIAYAAIMTGDLKKKAVGKGGGPGTKKPQITGAANVFFNIQPPLSEKDVSSNHDHDMADAMWLMQIAIEEYADAVKKREANA